MKSVDLLIGKILLIGITVVDEGGEVIEQFQVYGPIVRVDSDGITIRRNKSGTDFVIPPDFNNIHDAQPGEYRLRSSGDVVVDPDFISSWTLNSGSIGKVVEYQKYGFRGYIKP